MESLNRPVELLRTMLNYAIDEKLLRADQSPFSERKTRSLIERSGENKRERIPTFGEEMALLEVCVDDRAHLRPAIIIASDTGLRQNEMFTLSWVEKDIDFEQRLIKLRAINAKGNKPRAIPMTQRVYDELMRLYEQNVNHPSGLVFGGLKEVKRSFKTACRLKGIFNLHKHDLRHAFVTRAILAGVPPAVVLKASGHSSDEWKRYLNVTPDVLQFLFNPLPGQDAEAVKAHGIAVMRQLTEALGMFWKLNRNREFFQFDWGSVAMSGME
jgi:integrase